MSTVLVLGALYCMRAPEDKLLEDQILPAVRVLSRVWLKVWPGVVGVWEQALPHRHQATATAVKGVGELAGVFTSLVGDCNKIATWNVRSLYKSGKVANVLMQMKRMGIGIMG